MIAADGSVLGRLTAWRCTQNYNAMEGARQSFYFGLRGAA